LLTELWRAPIAVPIIEEQCAAVGIGLLAERVFRHTCRAFIEIAVDTDECEAKVVRKARQRFIEQPGVTFTRSRPMMAAQASWSSEAVRPRATPGSQTLVEAWGEAASTGLSGLGKPSKLSNKHNERSPIP
jgi:hypothetical protein